MWRGKVWLLIGCLVANGCGVTAANYAAPALPMLLVVLVWAVTTALAFVVFLVIVTLLGH